MSVNRTFAEQAPRDQVERNADPQRYFSQPEDVDQSNHRVLSGTHPSQNLMTSGPTTFAPYGALMYVSPHQMPVLYDPTLPSMPSQPLPMDRAVVDSRFCSIPSNHQSVIREQNIPERHPPRSLVCTHNLPTSRERRLALGLEESEEVLHCDFKTHNPDAADATTTLTIWTTSRSSISTVTRKPVTIAFDVIKWKVMRVPGERQFYKKRLLYQIVNGIVHSYVTGIDADHIKSGIHDTITNAHHRCILCGTDLGTKDLLYRSTTCSADCSVKFRRSTLEVRAPGLENYDIYYDIGDALRVLWVAAMIAVRSRHISPPPSMTVDDVCYALKTAPGLFRIPKTLTTNAKHLEFGGAMRTLKRDPKTERFVAWSSTHYRGCLIPSRDFPNKSWLYAYNANLAIEKAYAQNWEVYGRRSSVVFHGTTVDRLYPIMCDGFRYDNNLIQNGRRYGAVST